MKLTRKEFEAQLALAKSLTGEVRKSQIDALRAATVVDVDEKGVETPIEIKIADEPVVAPVQPDIKGMIGSAVAEALKAIAKPAPLQQPAQKSFTVPAEAKRVSRLAAFKGDRGGVSAEERAYKFGMWAMAAIGIKSASEFCSTHGLVHKTAHSEGTNTTGGYLVLPEFSPDIIALMDVYGAARQLLKVEPMAADTKMINRRTSGLTAYFVAENGAGTESNKGWDQVQLVAKKIMAISRMSNELSADAAINIGDDLAKEMAYAFAYKEDACAFSGDGTSTYGGIVGIPQALINLCGVDEGAGIVLASGNLFSEFVLSDFNRVIGRLPQYADTPNAGWVCHKTFHETVMQKLAVAAGGVTSVEIMNGVRQRTFLGYPVTLANIMPSSDVNSQVACLFGDLKLAATLGDRANIAVSFSTEAVTGGESVFERDQIAVRGTERFDIVVHDIGTASVAGPVIGLISAAS